MMTATTVRNRILDASTEKVVHYGVLTEGSFEVKYHTSQPAANQWIAIGILGHKKFSLRPTPRQRMMVGVGQTEEAAVEALRERLGSQVLHAEQEFAVDWA